MQPLRVFAQIGAAILGVAIAAVAYAAETSSSPVAIPRFSDPKARLEKPDLPAGRVVKWATGDDYPPFHYSDADGQPAGFAVDLARAVCSELALACTLQAWRWDALLDTLDRRQSDVILAMVKPTPELRARFAMTERIHQTPARFVARRDKAIASTAAEALKGRSVAVVTGSSHEAFLKAFFPGAELKTFERAADAQSAVRNGEADLAFGDAAALAFWLNGAASENCCAFVGGAYAESRYFGEGVGAMLRPNDDRLRQAIDFALQRLDENGVYAEIYLRHFPVGLW
ncbi:transporter substrate-binding domain-containing protein [Methylopila turkensis]|uniref:ABC transporter substrate-binding protein n=1 Tax=Methylopila turkensis TaxID=1437816 RepID=A0A9W6JQI0_9HYPH|nr:transporter substrate-binding domain-containing protein [Methylopila turkensis]GLK80120.1 ABC transporter substrate-binding protein [Methylopila turkensis]